MLCAREANERETEKTRERFVLFNLLFVRIFLQPPPLMHLLRRMFFWIKKFLFQKFLYFALLFCHCFSWRNWKQRNAIWITLKRNFHWLKTLSRSISRCMGLTFRIRWVTILLFSWFRDHYYPAWSVDLIYVIGCVEAWPPAQTVDCNLI